MRTGPSSSQVRQSPAPRTVRPAPRAFSPPRPARCPSRHALPHNATHCPTRLAPHAVHPATFCPALHQTCPTPSTPSGCPAPPRVAHSSYHPAMPYPGPTPHTSRTLPATGLLFTLLPLILPHSALHPPIRHTPAPHHVSHPGPLCHLQVLTPSRPYLASLLRPVAGCFNGVQHIARCPRAKGKQTYGLNSRL